jgi:hypothetical protein
MAKNQRERREDEPDKDQRPRNRAYEARENALLWYKRCLDAHQGTFNGSNDFARRKLHTAVLSYYRILAQVKSSVNRAIEDEDGNDFWEEVPLFEHRGESVEGLESLERWEFKREHRVVTHNQFGKPQDQHVEAQPAQLTIHQAAQALKQLDKAAAELGLRYAVEQDTSRPFHDWREDYEDGVYE